MDLTKIVDHNKLLHIYSHSAIVTYLLACAMELINLY